MRCGLRLNPRPSHGLQLWKLLRPAGGTFLSTGSDRRKWDFFLIEKGEHLLSSGLPSSKIVTRIPSVPGYLLIEVSQAFWYGTVVI